MKSVIDTNVLIGALLSGRGINRQIIKHCFSGKIKPQISNALFLEYQDVFCREEILKSSLLDDKQTQDFLDDFLSICHWNEFYYKWRPNLTDEGDNHIIDLAIVSGSRWVITHSTRDFHFAELRFPELSIITPSKILEELT